MSILTCCAYCTLLTDMRIKNKDLKKEFTEVSARCYKIINHQFFNSLMRDEKKKIFSLCGLIQNWLIYIEQKGGVQTWIECLLIYCCGVSLFIFEVNLTYDSFCLLMNKFFIYKVIKKLFGIRLVKSNIKKKIWIIKFLICELSRKGKTK